MKGPTIKEANLYYRAWKTYGKEPQLTMINEECAELIKEVCKLKRHPDSSLLPILDEIVDVHIMCEQFLTIHAMFPVFYEIKREKLARLTDKLDAKDIEDNVERLKRADIHIPSPTCPKCKLVMVYAFAEKGRVSFFCPGCNSEKTVAIGGRGD